MRKWKQKAAVALIVALAGLQVMPAAADEADPKGKWKQTEEGWKYKVGDEFVKSRMVTTGDGEGGMASYYLDGNGVMLSEKRFTMKNPDAPDKPVWDCYALPSGKVAMKQWVYLDGDRMLAGNTGGDWFYFNGKGRMLKAMRKIKPVEDSAFFFKEDGKMLSQGWVWFPKEETEDDEDSEGVQVDSFGVIPDGESGGIYRYYQYEGYEARDKKLFLGNKVYEFSSKGVASQADESEKIEKVTNIELSDENEGLDENGRFKTVVGETLLIMFDVYFEGETTKSEEGQVMSRLRTLPQIEDAINNTDIVDGNGTDNVDGNDTNIVDGNNTDNADGDDTDIGDGNDIDNADRNDTNIVDGNDTNNADGNGTNNADGNGTNIVDGNDINNADGNGTNIVDGNDINNADGNGTNIVDGNDINNADGNGTNIVDGNDINNADGNGTNIVDGNDINNADGNGTNIVDGNDTNNADGNGTNNADGNDTDIVDGNDIDNADGNNVSNENNDINIPVTKFGIEARGEDIVLPTGAEYKLSDNHDFWCEISDSGFGNDKSFGFKISQCEVINDRTFVFEYTPKYPGTVSLEACVDGVHSTPVTIIADWSDNEEDALNAKAMAFDSVFDTANKKENASSVNNSVNELLYLCGEMKTEEEKEELLDRIDANLDDISAMESDYIMANNIEQSNAVSEEAKALLSSEEEPEIVGAVMNVGAETSRSGMKTVQFSVEPGSDVKLEEEYENQVSLDLSLSINGRNKSNLAMPVMVSVPIPEGIDTSDMVLYHQHGNREPVEIEDYDINGDMITFMTDSFSNFIFASGEVEEQEADNNNNNNSSGGNSRGGSSSGGKSHNSVKGWVSQTKGIITGEGSSYSKWQPEQAADGSMKWKLTYADGTTAAGTIQTRADGTTYEQPAWEKVNGAWYPFGADGFVKDGWVQDEQLGGIFYIDINQGMMTGWQLVDNKWYYFNPVSDGTMGILRVNTWIDGWYVGADGSWDQQPQVANQ